MAAPVHQLPSPDADPDTPEDDVPMTVFDHLGELRKRLVRSLMGIVPAMFVTWTYKEWLLDFLLAPYVVAHRNLGIEPRLSFDSITDPFVNYLLISAICGLLLASPWVFWQLWQFISPGLYEREKKMAMPFILASTICFAGGAMFGYAIVFPLGFETLLAFSGDLPSGTVSLEPVIMLGKFLPLATRLLLAFGVVFETPVVVTFLAMAGIVTARQLLDFGRWWVAVSIVLAALLTPPDIASQLMMFFPLVIMYYMSVGIAFIVERREGRAEE